jgi:hypothetical protein
MGAVKWLALTLALASSPAFAGDVSLTWIASPDGVSYLVYRDGTAVGSTTATSFMDIDVPATTVEYYATALSDIGIESEPSNVVVLNLGKPRPPSGLAASYRR